MHKLLVLCLSLSLCGSAAVAQHKPASKKKTTARRSTKAQAAKPKAAAPVVATPAKSAPAATAPAAAPANGPMLSFDQTVYDFGTRTEGDMVSYTFNFTNTGTEPLILSNVQTTCGCTATDWPKEPIMPGKTSAIKANFNTTGKMGQQNKVITIISNSKEGNTMVSIKGNVVQKPAQSEESHEGHNH